MLKSRFERWGRVDETRWERVKTEGRGGSDSFVSRRPQFFDPYQSRYNIVKKAEAKYAEADSMYKEAQGLNNNLNENRAAMKTRGTDTVGYERLENLVMEDATKVIPKAEAASKFIRESMREIAKESEDMTKGIEAAVEKWKFPL